MSREPCSGRNRLGSVTRPQYLWGLGPVLLLLASSTFGSSADCTEGDPQQNHNLTLGYAPALPNFDFTAGLQRWGDDKDHLPQGQEKTVRKIYINTLPIFDTTATHESYWLYRWINSVHTFTRPRVIERLLLFSTGDPVNERQLDESERLLRNESYIGDAEIRVVRDCQDSVDLEVVTREVWTLAPDISFKSSGGETSGHLGFRDSNFLGTGKSINLRFKQDPDRNKLQLHYNDPNFQGKRVNIGAHVEKNSDGYDRLFDVGLPFYALDARRSWGVSAADSKFAQYRYVDSIKTSGVQVQETLIGVIWGFSEGLVGGQVNRYAFGAQSEKKAYGTLSNELASAQVPGDLSLTYPFFEYQQVQDLYKIGFNINQIRRSEDIHLGRDLRVRLGYSAEGQRVILQGDWTDTWLARNEMLLQSSLDWRGLWRVKEQAIEDGELNLRIKFHRGQTKNRSLVVGAELSLLKNSLSQTELTLGGDKGLRGYESNYQSGDTVFLVSAEERVFTQYEPFDLFYIGYAAFVDVGRAWFRGQKSANDNWQTDVGLGLRLLPSKSDRGQVVHLDLAFTLKSRNGDRRMLLSVEMKKTL